jgi:hypothetical protein
MCFFFILLNGTEIRFLDYNIKLKFLLILLNIESVTLKKHWKRIMFITSIKYVGVSLLLLSIHYCSIQIYAGWCVPPTIYGVVASIFAVASPPCALLLSIAAKSQELYIAAWIAMSVAIVSFIGGIWNKLGK